MTREADVLFLHPVALDHHAADWLDVPRLRAPTLPGGGTRARARAGLTLDDMADEIVGWIHEPVHVVGCSMGGMVAMHLALRHPERVASLVLAFTAGRVASDVMLARADEAERRGAGLADDTMTRWFTPKSLAAENYLPAVRYARERLIHTDPAVIADHWRAIAGHDVLDELGAIAVPTTCIAGEMDKSTPPAAVDALVAAIPGSRLAVLDCAHMGFLERPAPFSALVRHHLAAISDRAPWEWTRSARAAAHAL